MPCNKTGCIIIKLVLTVTDNSLSAHQSALITIFSNKCLTFCRKLERSKRISFLICETAFWDINIFSLVGSLLFTCDRFVPYPFSLHAALSACNEIQVWLCLFTKHLHVVWDVFSSGGLLENCPSNWNVFLLSVPCNYHI